VTGGGAGAGRTGDFWDFLGFARFFLGFAWVSAGFSWVIPGLAWVPLGLFPGSLFLSSALFSTTSWVLIENLNFFCADGAWLLVAAVANCAK
jgi:hypothetical protein